MAKRRNVYVIRDVPVFGGHSPNLYVPKITVEIRLFWPPYLDHEPLVIETLHEVWEDAHWQVKQIEHVDKEPEYPPPYD